jgi:glycosyltransferase involved in cell wall biosynthesis
VKIGVALCTYNGERFVAAQVKSILGQTRAPDLLVACDDASTDGTFALLQSLKASSPVRFDLVRNPANLGYLRNFEQAMARCEADIVVLSDQDDEWRADRLAQLENAFAAAPALGGVFSDAEIVDERLASLGYGVLDALHADRDEREALGAGRLFPALLKRNLVTGATLAFRRSWLPELLPIPQAAVHDEWIALVIAARGSLRFLPERLIRYRQHGGNQIGARRLTVGDRARLLAKPRRAQNQRTLEVMRALAARLTGRVDAPTLAEIEHKIAHLERRIGLPTARLGRLAGVLGEIGNARYFRYSSGWRAIVRDLLSPM